MNSPNIANIPLNSEGAMELGMYPCLACNVGWTSWGNQGFDSCEKSCTQLKRFYDKDEMALIQILASR